MRLLLIQVRWVICTSPTHSAVRFRQMFNWVETYDITLEFQMETVENKTLILVRLQFCSLISDDMGPSSIISPLVWQDVLKIKELLLFPHTTKFQLFASRYIIQDTNIWKYSIMPYGLRARELASRTGLNSRAQLSQSVLSTVCLQLGAESWYECTFSMYTWIINLILCNLKASNIFQIYFRPEDRSTRTKSQTAFTFFMRCQYLCWNIVKNQ